MKLKSYAGKTDQGPCFNVNEDGQDLDFANNLYLIIDAFGGAGRGDVCVRKLTEKIKIFYTKIGDDPEATMPFYYSSKYLLEGNALINAFHIAHKFIYKENLTKNYSYRAGASVLAVAESENLVTLVSTGNCIGYLLRQGKLIEVISPDALELLSEDHFENYKRTSPLSAIGLFEDIHLQVKELKILDNDILLLMTDGAYGRIQEYEIKKVIEQYPDNLVKAIDRIFEIVNLRGNLDNQSSILLKY